MTPDEAHRVVQDFLDRQGEATIAGDIERTLDWCDLPCTLETMEYKIVVETEEEMRAVCLSFIERLKAKRLTHMVRRCLEATFVDADTLSATYETRYIREGTYLADEQYLGFVVLLRRETGWKISSMQFADETDTSVNQTVRERSFEQIDPGCAPGPTAGKGSFKAS